VPGDPAALIAGPGGTQAQIERIRTELGFDRSVGRQYLGFLRDVARGDLGRSLAFQRPVVSVLAGRIGPTLSLMATSLALTVIVAVPAGLLAAVRPLGMGSQGLMMATILFLSVPNFLVGLLLMDLLVVRLGWLPAAGTGGVLFLVMPTLAIAARLVALVSRTTRASLLEVLGEDYVRTARAKGLPHRAVVLRHALPNSLLSLITLFGLTFPALASGAVIVERIFGLPGMGKLTFDAVLGRDVPVLMGAVTLAGIVTALGMLVSDLLYAAADPRISFAGTRA